MHSDWSNQEITFILETYFQMLDLEISGQYYNKSEFRRDLQKQLNNRSEGAIEFKHQNISAVLLGLGLPYIIGYKPRGHYQAILEEGILEFLAGRNEIDRIFSHFVQNEELEIPGKLNFQKFLVNPPAPPHPQEPVINYQSIGLRKTNYIELEQRNQKLGTLGESLVVSYEKWRLTRAGKEKLAEKVEWIAQEQGDGAGFDILSRNENGTDRYIEVKTTKLGELTPFYFTRNELNFSRKKTENYFLYRVFQFAKGPRLFMKNGCFEEFCQFEPVNYIGKIS